MKSKDFIVETNDLELDAYPTPSMPEPQQRPGQMVEWSTLTGGDMRLT